MKHWHAGDGAPGLERDRVHGIVRADNERHVGVGEVVVDFIHFEDNC